MSPVWKVAALSVAALALLVIVLVATFTAVGIWRMLQYTAANETRWHPRHKISDIYDDLQTGDIILFVSAVSNGVNSMVTQSFYSHAGMVVRDSSTDFSSDRVYLSETIRGSGIMPGADATVKRSRFGVDLTPLLLRLKYYIGTCYWLRLAGGADSSRLDARREEAIRAEAFALHRGGYPYPTFAQALIGLLGWKSESRHCFQHVVHLLKTGNLLDGDDGIISSCATVGELAGQRLEGGYYYAPPVQILYDIGL